MYSGYDERFLGLAQAFVTRKMNDRPFC